MSVTAIKCITLDGRNDSVLIYHLVIECCLELMRLRSSILLLVTNMDGLQIQTTIYRNLSAIMNKISTFKTHLIMFSLLKQKKVIMDSLSHKIHRLLRQNNNENNDEVNKT